MSHYYKGDKKRFCVICEKELTRYHKECCSLDCKYKLFRHRGSKEYICEICGKNFIDKNTTKRRFCSMECAVEGKSYTKSSSWKGGRHIGSGGYIRITLPNGSRIREHRFVYEKFLGRKLKRSEHIHHIDGNKTNNKLDNLLLCSNKEHFKVHNPNGLRAKEHIKGR